MTEISQIQSQSVEVRSIPQSQNNLRGGEIAQIDTSMNSQEYGGGGSNAQPDLQGSGSIANTIVLIFLWNYFLGLLYSGADTD